MQWAQARNKVKVMSLFIPESIHEWWRPMTPEELRSLPDLFQRVSEAFVQKVSCTGPDCSEIVIPLHYTTYDYRRSEEERGIHYVKANYLRGGFPEAFGLYCGNVPAEDELLSIAEFLSGKPRRFEARNVPGNVDMDSDEQYVYSLLTMATHMADFLPYFEDIPTTNKYYPYELKMLEKAQKDIHILGDRIKEEFSRY
jgi:hypothetical protein